MASTRPAVARMAATAAVMVSTFIRLSFSISRSRRKIGKLIAQARSWVQSTRGDPQKLRITRLLRVLWRVNVGPKGEVGHDGITEKLVDSSGNAAREPRFRRPPVAGVGA